MLISLLSLVFGLGDGGETSVDINQSALRYVPNDEALNCSIFACHFPVLTSLSLITAMATSCYNNFVSRQDRKFCI
jgi:hypothetical protein